MAYTTSDSRFDDIQLHGPTCPSHGRSGCECCRECGLSGGHARHCEGGAQAAGVAAFAESIDVGVSRDDLARASGFTGGALGAWHDGWDEAVECVA